jgi:hypothetical protein
MKTRHVAVNATFIDDGESSESDSGSDINDNNNDDYNDYDDDDNDNDNDNDNGGSDNDDDDDDNDNDNNSGPDLKAFSVRDWLEYLSGKYKITSVVNQLTPIKIDLGDKNIFIQCYDELCYANNGSSSLIQWLEYWKHILEKGYPVKQMINQSPRLETQR